MSSAGYSSTPLIKKLGLKPEYRIWLIDAPKDYPDLLGINPTPQIAPKNQLPDWIHLFASNQTAFVKAMVRINQAAFGPSPTQIVGKSGTKPIKSKIVGESGGNTALITWVSWYKKSSGIATDLNENNIRDYALANGWVDVKVCAVSETWSGLKLVVPLINR